MRNRGERRHNTEKKIKHMADRFYYEHHWYSRAEAMRIAKAGGKNFPRWVWDPERGR
jgi:hypothetical protein